MNKAEIISRHAQALKVQVGTSLAIDECEDIMASMMNEAINFIRCCKSDSEQLCEYCGLPLQEGVNLDYCKNDYCTRND